MRVLLVDDERLALVHLKHMLEKVMSRIEVVGMTNDPEAAEKIALETKPDAIFLDIHMPQMSGLQLGERIQSFLPHVEIIFVTAYDQYAVQAYELYAVDYIMKPVQLSRLQQTVQRLQERLKYKSLKTSDSQTVRISCFQQIQFEIPNREPFAIKWRTSKAQELFAYLLHHRERMVDRSTLIELFWPSFELERATQQLYTTVYHIRQALKKHGIEKVSIQSGDLEAGYRLSFNNISLDTAEWERMLNQSGKPNKQNIAAHEEVFRLYKGDYLGDYGYLWAEYERERMRRLFLGHAETLTAYYCEQEMWQQAIDVNQYVQELYPYYEGSYESMMRLYHKLSDRVKVEEQYWLLTSRAEEDGEGPIHPDIIQWYQTWKREQ